MNAIYFFNRSSCISDGPFHNRAGFECPSGFIITKL